MRAILDRYGHGELAKQQLVRATEDGRVAIPMRTAAGDISNVAMLDEHDEVTFLDPRDREGAFFGALDQIATGFDVVITTGALDAMTASVMRWSWSPLKTIVIGAIDTDHYVQIATQAIPRARLARANLKLTVQATQESADAAVDVSRIAISKGFKLYRDLEIVVHDPVESLTDAWLAGWRPRR